MKMNYNVLSQLNEKVNRHINLFDTTKQMLLEKINKLETQVINRDLENNPLNNFNFPAHEESLKKLEDAVEQLENEVDLLKDKTGQAIQDEIRHQREENDNLKIYVTNINQRMEQMEDENQR